MDKKQESQKRNVGQEPKPGEGIRSLQTWQKLAAARKALAAEGGKEQMAQDPSAYLRRFGVEDEAGMPGHSDLEQRLAMMDPGKEPQVELRSEARRGVAAIAAVWAGVIAVNAVKAANAAWHANAALNFNANANANANWNYNWNYASGV
jgi:hypothetical protein